MDATATTSTTTTSTGPSDLIDMTSEDSKQDATTIDLTEEDNEHRKKRRKLEDGSSSSTPPPPPTTTTTTAATAPKSDLVQAAKSRLSKWAARLFDKNRPRGLIEPPQIIPLNDEFLAAFGKREKETDMETGRSLQLDETIDDPGMEDQDDESKLLQQQQQASTKAKREGCKVKITNLSYTTSAATLQKACETFGPLEDINLILDKDRQGGPTILNSGRAYVTFETPESAELCVERLVELDGRQLRLAIASDNPMFRKSTSGGATTRYWDLDISTVCYRCGKVGHVEADCTNEAKPRPCPLCSRLDHDMRACPTSRVCFNCGVPGHVNRECNQPRGLPKRMVCGICFQSGHHRLQCRSRPTDAPTADAICMVCGKRGHFMCKEMKWFYGLDGVSCFNCGGQGHTGYDCPRPTLFDCVQDPNLTMNEIERAEADSLAEEMEKQRQRSRGLARQSSGDRGRRRSLPPPRGRNNQRQHSGGGDGNGYGGGRGGWGGGGGGGGRPRVPIDRSRGYR